MTTKTKTKLLETKIDLAADTREQMTALLNQELADMADLYSQTKQAHWNVKGAQFIALHKLFDELAEAVLDYVDEMAERVVQLGGTAMGTNRMSASNSRLDEYPSSVMDSLEHVNALSDRYAQVAASIRSGIDTADEAEDQGTVDLLSGISQNMDKWLWFLEAHLQA